MSFQGMIFDFNGVLWWDDQLQVQAWRQFAEKQFGISLTYEMLEVEVFGRNNRHTLEFLAGKVLDPQQVAQLSRQKEILYRSLCLSQGADFRLSPGAEDLLDVLKENNIPRTIATASGRENLLFFIDHLQLERWFDPALIIYDDGVIPGKPSPGIYLRAAEKLRLNPEECVVIEDSVSGIRSAQSAGIGLIITLQPAGAQPRQSKLTRDTLVVDNLAQIPLQDLFGPTQKEVPAVPPQDNDIK